MRQPPAFLSKAALALALVAGLAPSAQAAWRYLGFPIADPNIDAMRFDTPEQAHSMAVSLLAQRETGTGTYLRDWLYPGPSYAEGRLDSKVCFLYANFDPNGTYDAATCTGSINTVYAVYAFTGPIDMDKSRFLNLDVGTPNEGLCVGNPINVATGNKFQQATDIYGAGPEPLQFTRYYNSALNLSGPAAGDLGGWSHTYSAQVEVNIPKYGVSMVALHRPTGEQQLFYRVGTTWKATWDTQDQLLEINGAYTPGEHYDDNGLPVSVPATISNDGWRYERSNGVVETYSSDGQLLSISYPSGNLVTLAYSAGGTLESVSDAFGRTLSLQQVAGRIVQITDPAGQITAYGYTPAGSLGTITYPDASTRTLLYEDSSHPALLTGLLDERGTAFAHWSYDAAGLAVQSEHANGADKFTVSYAPAGPRTATNALGHVQTFTFDTINGKNMPLTVEGAPCTGFLGGTTTYSYTQRGKLSSIKDAEGQSRTFLYNTRGLQTRQTTTDGVVVNTDWAPTFERPTKITEPTRITEFTYDAHLRVLTRTVAERAGSASQSRTWTYTYHPDGPSGPNGEPGTPGQLATIDGPRTDVSDITTLEYDAQGNLTKVTNALGHETLFGLYTANGQPQQMVDANGGVHTFSYNYRGQLLTSTGPEGTTTLAYDPTGLLASQLLPNGQSLSFEYDQAQRLIASIDALGNRNELTPDELGNITDQTLRETGGTAQWFEQHTFNEIGWLLDSTDALGNTTAYAYDRVANVTSQITPAGDTYSYLYDGFHHRTRITDPLAGVTAFGYTNGVLSRVTDPRSKPTIYTRNGFGEITKFDSRDAGVTTLTYDEAGNVATRTNALGQVLSFTYDALNRLTGTTSSVLAEAPTVFAYDDPGAANGIGRLTSVLEGSRSTLYGYDAAGRVATVSHTVQGQAFGLGYAYDGAGNLDVLTYPSGRTVTYTRDAAGQITDVVTGAGGVPSIVANQIEYAPFGPVTQIGHSNGMLEDRQLDAAYRTTSITVPGVLSRSYSYTANGNVATVNAQTLGYDKLDRLTSATGVYGTLGFEYDKTSNRSAETRSGVRNAYTTSTSNNWLMKRAVGPITYTHNATGNVTVRGTDTFSYDSQGRMTGATVAGLSATYSYNELNQRVAKTVTGSTTLYAYGPGGQLLAEIDGATGATLREYLWLDTLPLAYIDGGTVYHIHSDNLGAPQILTDSTGQIVWEAEYEPFGKANTLGLAFNLRLPGQYFDAETGLHYNWNRYYDTATGRYLSYDPIGMLGGINPYLYAGANPLGLIDPEGLVGIGGAIYGGIAGSIGGYVTGGWEGIPTGFVAGAAVGFFFPQTSYWYGSAISAAVSSSFGQATGLWMTEKSITEPDNYDLGAICGAAFGGAIGGPVGGTVGRYFDPIRRPIIGNPLNYQSINRANQDTIKSILEGTLIGIGEHTGRELGARK